MNKILTASFIKAMTYYDIVYYDEINELPGFSTGAKSRENFSHVTFDFEPRDLDHYIKSECAPDCAYVLTASLTTDSTHDSNMPYVVLSKPIIVSRESNLHELTNWLYDKLGDADMYIMSADDMIVFTIQPLLHNGYTFNRNKPACLEIYNFDW